MAAGGWGCPHEIDGKCGKINNLPCDPGMKGCELYGRFVFFNPDKNTRPRQKVAAHTAPTLNPAPSAPTEEKQ